MWYAKLIPVSLLSRQLKKPSGFVGRYLMSHFFKKGNAGINDFVAECMQLNDKDHVLEIGYGPGYLTNQIANITTHGRVEGIDFSETMLNKATAVNKTHIENGRVVLHQGDSKNLPMADNSFNKICTVNTIYFLEDPIVYFTEMLRVLKPSGKLVIGFRDKIQLQDVSLSNDVFTLYTQQQVIQMLQQAGFNNAIIESKEDAPFTSYCAIATK